MKAFTVRVRATRRRAVVKAQSAAAAHKKGAALWPGRAVMVCPAA